MSILTSVSTEDFSPRGLWKAWPEVRFVTTLAPSLRHEKLLKYHRELAARYPAGIHLEDIGHSYQGRVIQLLKLGVGENQILLWSQMHGDEPSATPALLDIADYLLANGDHPVVRSILESTTLLMIPMLNPDGAEVYERVNAQGIDINRDALHLATPEGRLLKRIRDEYEPMLGLNLHDQDRMTTVGATGRLATNSVLAVSGDAEHTLTQGRLLAKRACAAIVDALAAFMPGGMARYYDDWSPRAFGDNITAWGTPVVLIESGGLPAGHAITELTRLNFVAILTVLKGLAEDGLAGYDPQVYEDLPGNQSDSWSDVVVRGGQVLQPGASEAYRSDLAFNYQRTGRQSVEINAMTRIPSQIFLLGDACCHGAGASVNAHGKVLLAAFEVGVIGWSERHWLEQRNLASLAQMGVGTVYWAVDEADYVKATLHSDRLFLRGMPRIRVLSSPSEFPEIILSEPPAETGSKLLGSVLQALGVDNLQEGSTTRQLWMESTGAGFKSARLRKDQPASFLVVSPAADGQVDFETSRLLSVWLDGHEIALE